METEKDLQPENVEDERFDGHDYEDGFDYRGDDELDDGFDPEPAEETRDDLSPKEVGRRGEAAAARFLERRGYEILERNWKCQYGEADIIARSEEGAIVFVEVKTRTSVAKGFPSEAVDAEKRGRYERIAASYLKDCDVVDVPVRFDVVALLVCGTDRALVKHHINAFSAGC